MKKIFFIIFLLLIFTSLVPNLADASLVPCGSRIDDTTTSEIDESQPCTLCHFFVLFGNVIDFLMIQIVPPLAILIIVYGGIKFMIAGESKEKVDEAKKLMKAVIIGLFIIFGAWIFLNAFFSAIGVQEWTGLKDGWSIINCSIE